MQASDFSDHISRRFNQDIEALRSKVLAMGGMVESQLSKAIEAVVSGDSELGLQVANDDYKVNDLEVSIDEECSRVLATRAPAAGDLRLIVAIIKTITDLERVGDEAEKIGYLASRLAAMDRPADSYRELKTLGNHVLHMLRDAMNAFARLDVNEALSVVREDERVDEEYEAIQRQCITFMMEDPRSIKRVMNVTWAARSLERIGDHAKNICEYVIYMVQGRDVRHTDISAATVIDSTENRWKLPSRRIVNLAAFLFCAGLMGFALYAEHVLLLEPCPLCVFQRIAVIGLGIAFALLAIHDPGPGWARRIYLAILDLAAVGGIVVAGRHVWLQSLPPDKVPSCGPGLGYMLDTFPLGEALKQVFSGSGECADVAWSFLGLSMPAWVLVCVIGLAGVGLWNNLHPTRA